MFSKLSVSFTILATWLTFSIPALAVEVEKKGACRAEVEKICPNLTMKTGLGKCLRAHKSEFSKECQEKAEERRAEIKVALTDCKVDMKKLCAGVEKGQGRIVQCLKQNTAKLSPACKSHVEKAPEL